MVQQYTLPVGTTLKSPSYTYKIKRVLGQGSFGIAYWAEMAYKIQIDGEYVTKTKDVALKEFFMHDINGQDGTTVTDTGGSRLFSL